MADIKPGFYWVRSAGSEWEVGRVDGGAVFCMDDGIANSPSGFEFGPRIEPPDAAPLQAMVRASFCPHGQSYEHERIWAALASDGCVGNGAVGDRVTADVPRMLGALDAVSDVLRGLLGMEPIATPPGRLSPQALAAIRERSERPDSAAGMYADLVALLEHVDAMAGTREAGANPTGTPPPAMPEGLTLRVFDNDTENRGRPCLYREGSGDDAIYFRDLEEALAAGRALVAWAEAQKAGGR